MKNIEIETGIPIPKSLAKTLRAMNAGESFVTSKNFARSASIIGKRSGFKVVTRCIDKEKREFRVWKDS